MIITHINPDSLLKSPAFSQAVLAGNTLYIGGQNGRLKDGSLAGAEFVQQVEQAYKNILEILAAVGASQKHVVKLTIYAVKGTSIKDGYAAAQKVWGNHPTAITVVTVDMLGGGPEVLVEIDGIAVLEKPN